MLRKLLVETKKWIFKFWLRIDLDWIIQNIFLAAYFFDMTTFWIQNVWSVKIFRNTLAILDFFCVHTTLISIQKIKKKKTFSCHNTNSNFKILITRCRMVQCADMMPPNIPARQICPTHILPQCNYFQIISWIENVQNPMSHHLIF